MDHEIKTIRGAAKIIILVKHFGIIFFSWIIKDARFINYKKLKITIKPLKRFF